MTIYQVAIQESEEGFSVRCLGLPGCWSEGATEEAALNHIRIAIREYVEAAIELALREDARIIELDVG
jgi:predicted RNase H-like HicB family nuclease